MNEALSTLFPRLIRCFAPRYLPWHVLAIGLTAAIVLSGLDWKWFIVTQGVYRLFFAAAVLGFLVPVFVPLGILISGKRRKDAERVRAAWMLAQAELVGLLLSFVYKAFTGRIQPNLHDYVRDISHGFNFGILRHGVFWGWPSSHTTVAFAMAAALAAYHPHLRRMRFLVFVYAALIGIGVSMSIHWLSDAVAGVVFGVIAGTVVGRAYANSR